MDAIDPRIDYLEIDKMILRGDHDNFHEYCIKMGCDIYEVISVWFDASKPKGLIILNDDGCCYFPNYKINFDQSPIQYQYNFTNMLISGRTHISIFAWSSFSLPSNLLPGSSSTYISKVLSSDHKGSGYITEVQCDHHVRVSMQLNWWKER